MTPGNDTEDGEQEGEAELEDKEDLKKFRGAAVRANYLAQGRSDLAFAAKAVCRDLAKTDNGQLEETAAPHPVVGEPHAARALL